MGMIEKYLYLDWHIYWQKMIKYALVDSDNVPKAHYL